MSKSYGFIEITGVVAAIDALEWNEIVGSIAGDDTIMCAVRTVNDTLLVMNKIKKLIKNN